MNIVYAFVSVVGVSMLSLLGAIFFVLVTRSINKSIASLLAISSGVLLGSAFLDLLPESFVRMPQQALPVALSGIVFFFSLEKFLQWHHHVDGDHAPVDCSAKADAHVGYLSLIGDGVHNFVDGILIGASYLVSIPLGVTTTIAVIAHEIPHEMADFTILLYSGFSRRKALLFNFLSATTAILGTLSVVLAAHVSETLVPYFVPFSAGNFIYIAAADLIPELHKRRSPAVSLIQVALVILGIFIAASV